MTIGVVLAQVWHDDDHMGGGWWWVMGIGWLIFLGLLVTLAYLLVRHSTGRAGGGQERQSRAEDLLAERFARGEIDESEYRARRDTLRG
jgi:putative membrane protein